MLVEVGDRLVVHNLDRARFFNPKIKAGSYCEVESIFSLGSVSVAVLLFRSITEAKKKLRDYYCREYIALSRGIENYLEAA